MANLGLEGVPIGLDCLQCGKPVTVNYIAHGQVKEFLVSDLVQRLVVAAARHVIETKGAEHQRCAECKDLPADTKA